MIWKYGKWENWFLVALVFGPIILLLIAWLALPSLLRGFGCSAATESGASAGKCC